MDARKTGELIAKLRRDRNMSQTDLAERLGVTNKAISRWETGRGYPDIEILPDLAKALDISIQELLDGQIIESPDLSETEQRSLEYVCTYAGQQRKKQTKLIVSLSVLLFFLACIMCFLFLLPHFIGFYFSIIGSDSCVIASDYSTLTYCGQTYIPLPMNGYECRTGDCMVPEAQVEGAGFLGKLFFGETLYEVNNVPNNEMVYLQTEYDGGISEYYVLESKYDYYETMLNESEYSCYYACRYNDDSYDREIALSKDFVDAFKGTSCEVQMEYPGRGIDIRVYEENHIFYRWEGELGREDQVYYWSPSEFHERADVHSGYYMSHCYYRIDDEYYDILSKYFDDLCG